MESDLKEDSGVNDFLQRIKELKDKQAQEDEERTTQLEEEILRKREERQARRKERARSLSPQKDSPAGTPLSYRPKVATPANTPSSGRGIGEVDSSEHETLESARSNALDKLTATPSSSSARDEDAGAQESSSMQSSSGRPLTTPANKPLSWQRRPQSMAASSFTTPSSLARSSTLGNQKELDEDEDEPLSREQISQNLLGKDPSWFRLSAERGSSSAALRKQKEEIFTPSPKMALPGMSESMPTPEPTKNPSPYPTSPFGSMRGSNLGSAHAKSKSLHFGNGASRFDAPVTADDATAHQSEDDMASELHNAVPASPKEEMTGSLRRRTPSPTKGLGGFVSSAMLRREGSVRMNKLAPMPPATGLTRAGSSTTERDWTPTTRRDTAPSQFSREVSREGTPEPDKETGGRGRGPFSPPQAGSSTLSDSDTSPTKPFGSGRFSPTKASWMMNAFERSDSRILTSTPTAKDVFAPPAGNTNRSPTRDAYFNRAETSPTRERSLREERIRARLSAQAVPRRNSQSTEKPDLRPNKPTVNPKPPALSPKPEREEPAAPESPPIETAEPYPKESEKEKEEYSREEEETRFFEDEPARASVSPTETDYKRASDPSEKTEKPEKPEKPASSKAVFERFTSNKTPIDPRELRARQQSIDEKADNPVAGFRSQLRPSKTQNYRAPNELKETILAGKAGLVSKGGPQNYKAPNELKEKVLAAKGSLHASSGPQKLVRPDPLKEQVASARGTLKQSGIVLSPTKPFVAPKPQSAATAPVGGMGSTSSTRPVTKQPSKSSFNVNSTKDDDEATPTRPTPNKQPSAPGRLEKPGGLADRFNPGLAGLLARGPMGPMGMPRPGGAGGGGMSGTPIVDESEVKKGPELQHMTKSRARGPKRRAPANKQTSEPTTTSSSSTPRAVSAASPKPPFPTPSPKPSRLSGVGVSPSPKPVENVAAAEAKSPPTTPNKPLSLSSRPSQESFTTPTKPVTPAKSPALGSMEFKSNGNGVSAQSDPRSPQDESSWTPSKPRTPYQNRQTPTNSPFMSSLKNRMAEMRDDGSSSPRALPQPPGMRAHDDMEDDQDETPVSVRHSAALWGSTNSTPDTTPRKSIQLPTSPEDVGPADGGSAWRTRQTPSKSSESRFSVIRPDPPSRSSTKESLSPAPAPSPKPTIISSNPEHFLAEFFTDSNGTAEKFEVDTARILESRMDDRMDKVLTTKKTMWEITGLNGKRDEVPEGQEHVLFEDALYLCVHSFMESSGMMATEVYLWSGEKVSQGTVEEAQLFARNIARENDGRLIVIKQGREVPNFFSALGGIVITRRGSRARIYDDQPYMLCCRRAQGGIALDEVEMNHSSLCAGFPYLLSTPDKLYLWKGRGAAPDETGAARLMAFDQAVNGEVKEITQGQEPEQFLEWLRGDAEDQAHADYWKLKPQCPKYGARVFLIDHTFPAKVSEIRPFNQDDLDPSCIYVVDAFFEMYIVLGGRAQSKRLDFQLALQFTSEYAILAASMEDRPFVPLSTIILGGVPREFKALFRRWEDAKIPTEWHPSRRPSLRVMVGLDQAMALMGV